MRALLLLIFVVLVLSLVGWLSFSRDADRSSINVETERIRSDTKEVMQSGAQLLQKAGERIEDETARDSTTTTTTSDSASTR